MMVFLLTNRVRELISSTLRCRPSLSIPPADTKGKQHKTLVDAPAATPTVKRPVPLPAELQCMVKELERTVSAPAEPPALASPLAQTADQDINSWSCSHHQKIWMRTELQSLGLWPGFQHMLKPGHALSLWRLPPQPELMDTASTLPSRNLFQLHPFFIWKPESDIMVRLRDNYVLPCLHGCPKPDVVSAGVGRPRVIVGTNRQYYIFASRLRCETCKRMWFADSPRWLDKLPKRFTNIVPAFLTYKKAFCKSVLHELRRTGKSPSDMAKQVNKLLHLKYEQAHLAYLCSIQNTWDAEAGVCGQQTPVRKEEAPWSFGAYDDADGWCGVSVSASYLSDCLTDMCKLQQGTFGQVLRSDHTRKADSLVPVSPPPGPTPSANLAPSTPAPVAQLPQLQPAESHNVQLMSQGSTGHPAIMETSPLPLETQKLWQTGGSETVRVPVVVLPPATVNPVDPDQVPPEKPLAEDKVQKMLQDILQQQQQFQQQLQQVQLLRQEQQQKPRQSKTCHACGQPMSRHQNDGSSIHHFYQQGPTRYHYCSTKVFQRYSAEGLTDSRMPFEAFAQTAFFQRELQLTKGRVEEKAAKRRKLMEPVAPQTQGRMCRFCHTALKQSPHSKHIHTGFPGVAGKYIYCPPKVLNLYRPQGMVKEMTWREFQASPFYAMEKERWTVERKK
uniref:uncharacterized protein LOC122772949 isoform X1 n=1 Tax=Solea senegalensis TaxID=28829 RepID=UPI001CD84647|nr:uncharacterized protein LOC122772949 isoform X1 [Solea senegalensis]XP_043887200.1 uncharacterized protein LOC122772949 isoform X1 [Solea senegalensis]